MNCVGYPDVIDLLERVRTDENTLLIDMAVDAVKKQIPMRPKALVIEENGKPIHPCGNCGEDLGRAEYCRWCGQKVGWRD